MIDTADLAHCREAIRHGSLSFYTASRLLPARVRDPALALYAFCRLADDEVDLGDAKTAAVTDLKDRLERVYDGRPRNAAPDRAFAAIVEQFEMPRALPEALLEGLAWDALERRYQTLSDVRSYSARVAAAVGAMMCVLMRVRDRDALARACDLGVAMQLTNIARDVGEDAREGRLYLPLDWFEEAWIDPDAFLASPEPSRAIRAMVHRLLREADRLYTRAEAGVPSLPVEARTGIYAARHIYAAIGPRIRKADHDSVTRRAVTSKGTKLGLLGLSIWQTGLSLAWPRSPVIYARPLPEVAFLVDATADPGTRAPDWSDTLYATFATLKTREEAR
ncbi:15-cis-phytoene synthase [Pseudaestuariivita atlantica]|uniref:Phytoene synthase n=1 Tax=Pseudaestuariivita atlantica TaxID=1317121 RepID=A0A0L1JQ92_9RHOB|nr:phytoene/squalene synthase family protein [Pseudaestuariivita atlantica]KNG93916.1 phytoene synthase [Pseudaestuariivita atlantica]